MFDTPTPPHLTRSHIWSGDLGRQQEARCVPFRIALRKKTSRTDYFSQGEAAGTASFAAELSRLAYCRKQPSLSFDSDLIRSVLAKIGFGDCKFFESPGATSKGGTHCFSAVGTDQESGRKIGLLAFRGTDADDPTDIW